MAEDVDAVVAHQIEVPSAVGIPEVDPLAAHQRNVALRVQRRLEVLVGPDDVDVQRLTHASAPIGALAITTVPSPARARRTGCRTRASRSEEHTSELQ